MDIPYLRNAAILTPYIFKILPQVNRQLLIWKELAQKIPDDNLRSQALASLSQKKFHCQGAGVFAVGQPKLLSLLVSYQTLCDYLDNLCDRGSSLEGEAFSLLHRSLLDALTPDNPITDYYALYPWQNDPDYLRQLVLTCQQEIRQFPQYHKVYPPIRRLAEKYIDLQVYKHQAPGLREKLLRDWALKNNPYSDLKWNEYAAAAGSTLGIFALLKACAAASINQEQAEQIYTLYFPDISALHILLDYYIDQAEDLAGGDLNFYRYYTGLEEGEERLIRLTRNIYKALGAKNLFLRTVVDGLLAMYLSDRKIKDSAYRTIKSHLLYQTSAKYTYRLCRLVRTLI